MSAERFTISSRATGIRRTVVVFIYDTVEELKAAAFTFNGFVCDDNAAAVTQGWGYHHGRPELLPVSAVVRMHHGMIDAEVVAHELAHAAMGIYMADRVCWHSRARAHFSLANEPFAYLLGQLVSMATYHLHRLGAWTPATIREGAPA
ncbi:hypothetical protein [Cryobacterium cryoconiti]|uniref:Uncharacterized protein n=1 Tax=Cryobacterium cryoconiti TaxID=1259239 RepID=A0A4Y8JSK3_9MICO|nr:hypothetical protein [Cryobacterium cryoconiti]TFD27500.1 hypothetical protein E3T49_13235 [Cryobacterium cryoconiti]